MPLLSGAEPIAKIAANYQLTITPWEGRYHAITQILQARISNSQQV